MVDFSWIRKSLFALVLLGPHLSAWAQDEPYLIQPGDVISVSVWGEENLQGDVIVRPDGDITFPLAGGIQAAGRSISDVQVELAHKLSISHRHRSQFQPISYWATRFML
jgi:polysaccharide export outer membrane protein